MTNKQIGRKLTETGALIELTGGNTFRARSFSNAGRTIERMDEQVVDLVDSGGLTDVRGIGQALANQIRELVETGTFSLREELLASIPPGVLEMLRVNGIGAKKARTIWKALNITSLDELEQAAEIGRLADLPGFGEKTQEKVLSSVQTYRRYSSARRFASVVTEMMPILDTLRRLDGVERAELSGALRRSIEIVSSADLIVGGNVDAIRRSLGAEWLDETGPNDEMVLTRVLPDGLALRVRVVPPASFGTTWWRDTGSVSHIERYIDRFGDPEPSPDEESIYRRAGMHFVEPELREGTGELDAATSDSLPTLIRLSDLKGCVHNHSTYSDGAHSLEEMAEAARGMGMEYFGICDHSRSLTIANGLSVERVLEQQHELRAINERYRAAGISFRVFGGIESDILVDGSLDYPDEVLASFDLVVASIHSRFNMTEEEATKRLITAVENPYTSILGHMTGRLLLTREGYAVDHQRVIDACAANGVAIEINANPHRLDMDWRWIRAARERSVLLSINPDAHSIDELRYMRWGIAVARKGWLTPEGCLNAKSLDEFSEWLTARSPHASA